MKIAHGTINQTTTWKPDWTLNRNIDPAEIGELVKDAFNYFHSPKDDPHQDGVRDILFTLQEKFFPGAVRVLSHEESAARFAEMEKEAGKADAASLAHVLDWLLFEIEKFSHDPVKVCGKADDARRILANLLEAYRTA